MKFKNLVYYISTIKFQGINDDDTPMKQIFFVPFMLAFFFINVQMFNAIINNSYNKASLDLQPMIERE
jgi:hypothetical protein